MQTRAFNPTPWLLHFNINHAIEVTGAQRTLYLSGQTATVAAGSGNMDPADQAREIFGYLKSAIEAAGGTMADICKVNLFLTDGSQIPAILEVRPQFFHPPYPAATLVMVNRLFRQEWLIEIEATAILDG